MNNKSPGIVLTFVPLLLGASISSALAAPLPGGTLDPLTIPKYVEPFVIPPVLYDDRNGRRPLNVEVALRQIQQQVLPTGFPQTTLWAYGNPQTPNSFNNPASTIEVTQNTLSTVTWKNELVDAVGNFLPHVIRDAAGNPLIDQTLHWAAPNQDCLDGVPRTDCRGASAAPYIGPIPMVTHLHGAHVAALSDGYPEAWWLPAANNIPAGFATEGTFYSDINGGAAGTGSAQYQYTNDQPTTTLWYHDHTLGMTRLNVYAAGAGFWLIRDRNGNESGLAARDAKNRRQQLPGPAPVYGVNPNGNNILERLTRRWIREIPIVIQPKSFNNDGSQFFPADRAFFQGFGTGLTFADNTGLNFPFLPAGAGPNPTPPPDILYTTTDISPVWNPETFFNTMVVNGKTWPELEVASERYRFRLLNAADSRFLNLSLREVVDTGADGVMGTADDTLGVEIPIYQIGSEQGLLPNVVRIETGFATPLPGNGQDVGTGVTAVTGTFAEQALLIAPAERADVIVDFSNLLDGTIVRMINTGPDVPYNGFPLVPADPDTTGQIMQFMINTRMNRLGLIGDRSTPPPDLVLDPNPGGVPKLAATNIFQDLALLEEQSAVVCVTIDAVTGEFNLDPASTPPNCDPTIGSLPFTPKAAVLGTDGSLGGTAQLWDDPISQNPQLGTVEEWSLWNHTADAHPIHLHLVKFQVVERQVMAGAARPPEPWEMGWKDTVVAYPGEVTRIRARFDIAGLYVWHCHILSHEDNEMMVPYCVGTPGTDCPAVLF